MSKLFSKKGQERRKKPRSGKSTTKGLSDPICLFCEKTLGKKEKALFVEEEIGRIFCSEDCITDYFTPEVEILEKEYKTTLKSDDLVGIEKEKLAHLRWLTLQEPGETWRQKTPSGDLRYTLISEFQPIDKPIWYICICLFLRGEPSFLYLAFPTKNPSLVDQYRRGEQIKTTHSKKAQDVPQDRLAESWTQEETDRARFLQDRKKDDIPIEEFGLYDACFDETLENPDEVWAIEKDLKHKKKTYHFIRFYPDDHPSGMWFIILAKETEDEDEIEILEAFPTRDATVVEYFRRGNQEVGIQDSPNTSRMVH